LLSTATLARSSAAFADETWEDREAWHRQALELEATAAALRAELTEVDARLRYLQRRAQ